MHRSGNAITRKIYDLVVEPNVGKIKTGGFGYILDYNKTTRLSCVSINVNGSNVVYNDVPIQDGMRGVVPAIPKSGDKVFVSFDNSVTPYITTVYHKQNNIRTINYGPSIPKSLGVI